MCKYDRIVKKVSMCFFKKGFLRGAFKKIVYEISNFFYEISTLKEMRRKFTDDYGF